WRVLWRGGPRVVETGVGGVGDGGLVKAGSSGVAVGGRPAPGVLGGAAGQNFGSRGTAGRWDCLMCGGAWGVALPRRQRAVALPRSKAWRRCGGGPMRASGRFAAEGFATSLTRRSRLGLRSIAPFA